jgi:hypothetical protein
MTEVVSAARYPGISHRADVGRVSGEFFSLRVHTGGGPPCTR